MMNIKEAMQALIDGKKIRRKYWHKEEYRQIKGLFLVNEKNETVAEFHVGSITIMFQSIPYWEEYIEPPKLVELPPEIPIEFGRHSPGINCSGCKINIPQIQNMYKWIKDLYKDRK